MSFNPLSGVTVRDIPLQQAYPGRVFWVNSSSVIPDKGVAGSDSTGTGVYLRPFATVDYAIGNCVASRGDIIAVMPGYTQTLTGATGIVLDVAGIALVGLGAGSKRPTITYESTDTSANIPITAANVSVINFLFVANKAALVAAFTASGTDTPTDFTIENCEFRDTSSILNFAILVKSNATANCFDGLNIRNNVVHGLGTTAGTTFVNLAVDCVHVRLMDNQVNMAALSGTPALAETAATAQTDFHAARNIIVRPSTDTASGVMCSAAGTCTGLVYDNLAHHKDTTGGNGLLVEASSGLGLIQNYCILDYAADKSGALNPATA